MKSKIMITDERPDVSVVDEFHDAYTKKAAREQTITKWILGHACDVILDNNPEWITMQVGAQKLRDRRAEYPSEKLIAAMSLAIYAGEGLAASNFDIQDLDDETVIAVLNRGTAAVGFRHYRGGKP